MDGKIMDFATTHRPQPANIEELALGRQAVEQSECRVVF